ncbi:MAG: protoporphyrinogen oxidase [Planctomycetes bacterium]|nr:protoporphyrinogen oxidase [Planctomycetota bacterium]
MSNVLTKLPTSNVSPRLAVIGGGISGLTAAYRLRQWLPRAEIELFEAGDRLGGVLHTRRDQGLLIECGADSFFNQLPAAVELCQELGLGEEIIPTNEEPRRALILHAGKLHRVPEGFVQMRPEKVGPMLRTRLLSWRGKLRLLAERWATSPTELANEDFDESVASFATRRLGREVFERMVQPLLAGVYTADPYRLSVAATMPTAFEAERKYGSLIAKVMADRKQASRDSGARYGSFVTLRNGMAQLIDTLVSQLNDVKIHLNTPIKNLTPTADQRWSVSQASGNETLVDGVIVALPAPRAGALLASTDAELSNKLQNIAYASSAVAVLVYRREQISDPLDGFGMVVPTVEGRQIVAASYSSVKFPGRAPADQVLIRVFVGGALQPELLERSDAEIVQLAQAELSDILGIRGEPLRAELVRWNEKMPQYHVGHLQLVDRIEDLVSKHVGLELAGNAYRGVGIPQCVQQANSAARRLAESFDLPSPSEG